MISEIKLALFLLLLFLPCMSTHTSAATWGVPGGTLDARAGSDSQQLAVNSFGLFDIPTVNGSTNGSVDTASSSLELTPVNNSLLLFESFADSSTDPAGTTFNASATSFFQLPFTLAEQARATLTAKVLKSGTLGTSVRVTNDPPDLTLSISIAEDTGGSPRSESQILSPGEYRFSGAILTEARNPEAHTGSIDGTLVITALADLDGDLSVGASDLAIWEAGFGMPASASPWDGDIDGDGIVSGSDFLQWQRDHGPVTSSIVAVVNVPEPASFLMAGASLLHRMLRRRRSRFGH